MQIVHVVFRWGMLLAVAAPSQAFAAESPPGQVFPLADDPVLEALLGEALESNPELLASREEAAAAAERVPQAGALPDPVVGLGYQYGGTRGVFGDEDSFVAVGLSQALPYPGKRRLAEQAESREAARARQPIERARLSLVARVRTAYTDLLLARDNLALIAEQEDATLGIEAITRSRYGVGLAEQADVLRAQAELARLQQMRRHEEGNVTAALAELNRLLARPSGTPVPPGVQLSSLGERRLEAAPLEPLLARADDASPEVAAARLALERSRLASELARRNRKPDFELGATYMNRGALPDMWGVSFGIVLPAYSKRKQGRAAAEAEARVRAAQAQLEAVRLAVRAGIERSHAEWQAAIREAESYATGVLVLDELASESALANYKTGKVPFVTVLEAHTSLYRDRWSYLELLAHVLWHSARVDEMQPAQ